ncbi:MAG TPA: ribose-5-phosphate isomerase RpiA [Solirubrobacteraceae bacterium]|nr:ribose-5-phosphate isomerase RpiA [Solirubrobacteraceae bacterium]
MAPAGASEAQPPLSEPEIERFKRAAARASAELVQDGMRVGLGTGTTVAFLLQALGERADALRATRCVATSPATAQIARGLGLEVVELDQLDGLDIAIDGADQVDERGWLVKGGGGAHTREKIVAAAAARFVVIVSANKQVARVGPPVPLEVLRFGERHTLQALGQARLREGPPSPDGNLLADYLGSFDDPALLAERASATPGVVEHGLFEPAMVSEIFSAGPSGVSRRAGGKAAG